MKIFLIGFMGAGKSFFGKRLAAKLKMDFIDLDNFIEENEGQSISTIFENKKEKGFRKIENQYLKILSKKTNTVIACGGGTPCFHNNMQWMNKNGLTIYLKSSNNLLFQRLKKGKRNRPLLKDLSDSELKRFIKIKVADRTGDYEMAKYSVYQRVGDIRYLEKLINVVALL